ncbi:hypothetical protein GUITHDRAFT_140299 [Guillardia theta CCMP2712]|uniref:Uncharacterized protein n=1 Tax=Guillardia theta (strain CCMP2712) TaxID=905079 RepID=L1J5V1_GUITC|nr:hypothetical protein GUITHDRAFT_140299 [Guillardia theta CCMP2712]EKX43876.1 hypothetical protein GUITHDRAFT_140299 [Guillardia theta CCMP2712]|eukprot:XP_005830856.1 hypothetical protein GUITHDRAFT_140299 [Guillardia theta CCMP2712]
MARPPTPPMPTGMEQDAMRMAYSKYQVKVILYSLSRKSAPSGGAIDAWLEERRREREGRQRSACQDPTYGAAKVQQRRAERILTASGDIVDLRHLSITGDGKFQQQQPRPGETAGAVLGRTGRRGSSASRSLRERSSKQQKQKLTGREDSVPTLEQAEKDFLVKLQKHNLRVRRKDATREMEVDYIELAERRLAPNPKPQVVLSASDEEEDEEELQAEDVVTTFVQQKLVTSELSSAHTSKLLYAFTREDSPDSFDSDGEGTDWRSESTRTSYTATLSRKGSRSSIAR